MKLRLPQLLKRWRKQSRDPDPPLLPEIERLLQALEQGDPAPRPRTRPMPKQPDRLPP